MRYKNIIWDYNGTIIDDAQLAVDAENVVLSSYGLPEIDIDFYMRECEMPIINFYRKIFPDFDSFDFSEIAKRFLHNYDKLFPTAKVFPEVTDMISKLSCSGIRQGVISGFESGRLRDSLKGFGLDGYFEFMSGSDDIDCGDKSDRAVAVCRKNGFSPSETLFVGDMYHDYETAQKVGADCVLIAKGHQGAEVLRKYGVTVLNSAGDLSEYFKETLIKSSAEVAPSDF